MLITWVDVLFTIVPGAIAIVMLKRRWNVPPAKGYAKRTTLTELILTALVMVVSAIGPNILVVATTPGLIEMPVLTKWALLPSMVLLAAVWILSRNLTLTRLTDRIWTGLWVGAVTVAFLDIIRLTGFQLGYMPGNMPRMFGVLILDHMAEGPTLLTDIIGSLYHVWVSICFGQTYALLVGKFRWWGGLIWGLIVEIGMMTTAPMVVAMDTGYFGLKKGYGLLTVSLLAHIAFGIALGILMERYLRHEGTIFKLLAEVFGGGNAGENTASVQ